VDDGGLLGVQVIYALENFLAPVLDHLQFRLPHFLEELAQTAACDHFGDEMNLLFLLADPGRHEGYYIPVLQLLYNVDFRFNPRAL
jgi:hypothetical protein